MPLTGAVTESVEYTGTPSIWRGPIEEHKNTHPTRLTWTPTEDELLKSMWGRELQDTLLQTFSPRSWHSIRSRARRLGLLKCQTGPRRLCGTRVYLAGGMDRVPDGGIGWRRKITPMLGELGIVVLDPTEKPFDNAIDETDREERKQWIRDRNYDAMSDFMKDVRGQDLRMVNICDFVIIRVDVNSHMCGSYEEIAIANHEKKPILVWVEQGKENTPWWMFGQVPHQHIFSTLEDLIKYLKDVDKGIDTNTYGRWYLLKQDILYSKHVLARLGHTA